jgi:hypothetical protein
MPSCSVPGLVSVKRPKMILVPSGDQRGWNGHLKPVVSSGSFLRSDPSGWTRKMEQ